MATHEEEAQGIERRRLQNRLAQRRFRQRRRATSGDGESEVQPENVVSPRENVTVNLDGVLSSTDFPHLNLGSPGHNPFPDLGDFDARYQIDFSIFEDDFCRLDTLVENTPMSIETLVPPSARSSPGYREHDRKTAEARPKVPRSTSDSTGGNIKHPVAAHIVEAETRGPNAKATGGNKTELLFQCRANGRGWLNALHIAAMRGNTMIVQCLLQQRMDPNSRDSDGLTALMHAAAGGHEDVAELLLGQGARLGEVDGRRRSALHWAVIAHREAMLRLLLKHADANDPFQVEVYDDAGHTPLHTAADLGFEAGVAVLLNFGADPYSRAKKS